MTSIVSKGRKIMAKEVKQELKSVKGYQLQRIYNQMKIKRKKFSGKLQAKDQLLVNVIDKKGSTSRRSI
jgi:hypothetical protein